MSYNLRRVCSRLRPALLSLCHHSRSPSSQATTSSMSHAPTKESHLKRARVDSSPTAAPSDLPAVEAPLRVKKISDKAHLPTRGSALSAGYDLYAARETRVPARGKVLVQTDLIIGVPPGTYGRIAPRSGLAAKHMIDTGAGVIDADYRGEVKVLLFNHGEEEFVISEGDRIAQLVLEKISTPDVIEVEVLDDTSRGAGGFGSTG